MVAALICTALLAPTVGAAEAAPAPSGPSTATATVAASTGRATSASPTTSATIPTMAKNAPFVSQVYATLLNRVASRSDAAFWGSRMDAGGVSPTMNTIGLSDEYVAGLLNAKYGLMLGRPIESGARAYWTGRVRAGLSIEEFLAYLAVAPEFASHAGGTNAAIVDSLYAALLGRAADASGHDHWVAVLAGGTSRADLVRALVHSPEYADRVTTAAYRKVFDRPLDLAGRLHWRTLFLTNAVGERTLPLILLASPEAVNSGCDPLVSRHCLLPFPNDYFTVDDPSSPTGRRVALRQGTLPTNLNGVPTDPRSANRSDGFSVGAAVLAYVPGIDLVQTGATPITDIARSLDADSPIVIIDAATGQRVPTWVEVDSNAPPSGRPTNQLIYVRAAKDFQAGHRYVVAMRQLKDGNGAVIPAGDVFARYRDNQPEPGNVDGFERRRPHMEQLFSELAQAGVARNNLYLAWDFTTASTGNTTDRLLHIRDDAFARIGSGAPSFHVTQVDLNPRAGVAKRIKGTYQVPSYLTQDGPGGTFLEGPDGLPRYAGHDLTTTFTCMVPTTALTTPGRGVVYGHGLFGDQGEVEGQYMIAAHNMVYCATDWLGMASADVGTAAGILGDVSLFPRLADRVQEGVVATLFLGRLLHRASGFVSDPAFQSNGQPVVDTSDVFYDGNSQGGILGGLTTAVSTEWTRAVLGVPGMNFNLLIDRSVDFAPFDDIAKASYPDRVDRVIGFDVIQAQWDRAEPDGYAAYLTDQPLANTPAHKVLMHVAVGDHQVAPVAADIEARTAGIPAHLPAVADGRTTDVVALWGIPGIAGYPYDGSALFYWDSGSPLPPTTNTPPSVGHDPHEDPRRAVTAGQQKSDFLQSTGTVTDPCNGQPCVIPQT